LNILRKTKDMVHNQTELFKLPISDQYVIGYFHLTKSPLPEVCYCGEWLCNSGIHH
jgi:hypothetical protein